MTKNNAPKIKKMRRDSWLPDSMIEVVLTPNDDDGYDVSYPDSGMSIGAIVPYMHAAERKIPGSRLVWRGEVKKRWVPVIDGSARYYMWSDSQAEAIRRLLTERELKD